MSRICLILAVLLLLTACSTGQSDKQGTRPPGSAAAPLLTVGQETPVPTPEQVQYIKITPQETQLMMAGNAIILDVRTQDEFDEGHIANAVLLPYTEIKEKAESVIADKNQTVLVYCRIGRRSEIASRELIDMGYTKVFDFGGIQDWIGEIVTSIDIDFKVTQRIHEQMPEWTFNLSGSKDRHDSWPDNKIEKITIKDNNGVIIQELDGIKTFNHLTSEENMYGLVFEDWNFDGYLDIGLWASPGGTMRNNPHYYWLWDNDSGKFVKNEQLEKISDYSTISVNTDTKQIESYTRTGPGMHATGYYEYSDGSFVMARTEEITIKPRSEDDDILWQCTVICELRRGEWAVIEEYCEDYED